MSAFTTAVRAKKQMFFTNRKSNQIMDLETRDSSSTYYYIVKSDWSSLNYHRITSMTAGASRPPDSLLPPRPQKLLKHPKIKMWLVVSG